MRLTWGDTGAKVYEAGIDRGVLYKGGVGVAWNGLISVDESPSGGTPLPYYMDGVKYLNIASAEEYAATIEAYSAPSEFDSCDGTAAIQNGLFATQQPRDTFGFSYRTGLGNDVLGMEFGYKIHLVYNALAGASTKSFATLSDRADPTTFKWPIVTNPPTITDFAPSAHIVIDTRLTHPSTLRDVERQLYGTDLITPNLPSPDEIRVIFETMVTAYGYGPYGHTPYGGNI